jgi:hypothetical protein
MGSKKYYLFDIIILKYMTAKTTAFRSLIIIGLCLFPSLIQAQVKNFSVIEFKSKEDYKTAEPKILEMANYVLGHPAGDSEENKKIYANIIKWMSGTPDYHFSMDNSIMDLSKNNEDVLPLYMVCATKAALENPLWSDEKKLKLRSFEILLDYCGEKANGISHNKEMKKAIEAKQKGQLEKYLGV